MQESIARFNGSFRVLESKDLELLGLSKASLISEASTLIPKEFNAEKNIDILPVVFNVAVVNQFNANHDGINTLNAAKILKQFIHKPINIEHTKTQIIGHIVNASFSDKQPEYEEGKEEEFNQRTTPFYITLAGFIYKHIYPGLAEVLIEASDPESPNYQAYSSSWEIRFTDYDIAVGSNLVSECKIYKRKENPESFAKCVDKLKSNGGTGFCEEGQVNRLLGGELYPLGCAFTENPAADVAGIYPLTSFLDDGDDDEEDEDDMDEEVEDKKNSNCSKKSVNRSDDENSDMTDEQLNKLLAALEGVKTSGESTASAKEIAKEIEGALKEFGTEWKSKAEKANEEIEDLKNKLSTASNELAEAKSQFESIKQDLEVKEAADRFNARMKAVEDIYDLSEAEIKFVADEVRVLGDDESFAKYLEKAAVIFAHKNKEALASKQGEKKEEKQEEKSDELETEGESKASIPNNNGNQTEEKSLIDQLKENGLEIEE